MNQQLLLGTRFNSHTNEFNDDRTDRSEHQHAYLTISCGDGFDRHMELLTK